MIKAEWTNKDSLDLQPTCNQLATTEGDFINRVDAIECVRWGESVTDVIDRIKALQSAEAVQGEWIIRTDNDPICRPWYNTCKCSKCGQYGTKVWNYCPSCGAKMNGGEEDD